MFSPAAMSRRLRAGQDKSGEPGASNARRRDATLIPRSAALADLAARANAEHAAYEATQSAAIAHAIACGEALNEAKAQLPHGEWLPWLRENFAGSRQTADNYRRIAANCQRAEAGEASGEGSGAEARMASQDQAQPPGPSMDPGAGQ
jgi:hypothetical protein